MGFRFHPFIETTRPAWGERPLIAAAGVSPAGAPVFFMEDDRLRVPSEAEEEVSGSSLAEIVEDNKWNRTGVKEEETAQDGEERTEKKGSSCSCCLLTAICLIAAAAGLFFSIIKIVVFVCVIILFAWVFSSVLF